ncbi:YebC/PmpR family DNA-binding transcriptional regulator, partial [Candidatus Parcubacteria bacterium]|nr:YebC/PmpR family DNA-binding transcriptional regulator [Candidatus Parcubacteria bacterium]
HSKWSTIKRKKGAADAKRGAIFTKLGHLITIAAKEKGADRDANFTLRMAVDKARNANMPKDNIERAIKRGTGELAGEAIEELVYEGFGPAKSQFIVKCLTDNKNRSAANIRHIFTKYGGSLGTVAWNFKQRGVIRISDSGPRPASLSGAGFQVSNFELDLIDAGVDDILEEKEGITLFTKIGNLQNVKKFLEAKEIKTESAEIEYISKEDQKLDQEDKEKVEKFIEELEDCEDVADYYHNINI